MKIGHHHPREGTLHRRRDGPLPFVTPTEVPYI